jgi:hypothetical protein
MYSTDGISWSDVTPGNSIEVMYYKDVAFDGSKYHVLGIESSAYVPVQFFTLSTATPGNAATYANKATCNNTPVGVVLGGNFDEGLLDYANGKFTGAVIDVATGQDYIITSTDGNSWTALPQNSTSIISSSYVNGSTIQMISRSNAFFTVSYGGILPVSLLNFNARLIQYDVKLTWTSTSEQNSKEFIIQHSIDGNKWNTIGTLAAAGNSSGHKDYSFVHSTPAEGTNFYRLKQQDINGSFMFTRVITVTNNQAQQIEYFPNPVIDQLMIQTHNAQPGYIIFYNTNGQVVKRASVTGYKTIIDLSALPTGTYIAELHQGQNHQKINVYKN